MTALNVETPVAPPPAPPQVASPGQLAADAALRQAREQAEDSPDPVQTWVNVTPAMADAWLKEFNPPTWKNARGETEQQRNQRRKIIAMYARAMERGEWLQTGDPIQFGKSGILLNGQHRLSAVVKARKTVRLSIMTDVDDNARVGMDNGIRRSVGDKLAMKGRKYVMHQGSVTRLIWDLKEDRTSRRPDPPSDVELLDMIDSDPTIEWVVTEVLPHLPVLGSKTVSGYCYWLLHQVDAEQCAYFFEKLKTLEELPKGSPIAALSARLRNASAGAYKDKVQVVSMVIGAWNSWRAGETRERIQARRNTDGHYEVPEPQ